MFLYPCCADDTEAPILQFIDKVKAFHFADTRSIQLPRPECGTKIVRTNGKIHLPKTQRNNHGAHSLPKDVIRDALKYPKEVRNASVKPRNLSDDVGSLHVPISTERNVWEMADGSERILYRHQGDAYLVFSDLQDIAVFYQRSNSDEGSSLYWFGPSLFRMLLDKLVDGGLIVTDGSMFHPEHMNVPWGLLRKHFLARNHEELELPPSFEYRARRFKCLGKIDNGHGPVYGWQVNHL